MNLSLFFNLDGSPGQTPEEIYADVEEITVLADRLGFAASWVAEHHFALYGRLPSPLLFLARLSALTERIGLGTAVVEAPHYNPVRLAEDAALLDSLSRGRLRLGLGSGTATKPTEFAAFDVPIREKSERTHEMVAFLNHAFTEGILDFEGTYLHCRAETPGILLDPRPVQTAQEMIYIAASASTPTWAGAGGYRMLVPRVGDATDHAAHIRRYRAALTGQAGYVALLRFVFVAETEQAAREQTRQAFARYARYDCRVEWDGRTDTAEYSDLLRRMNMVIGTPEQVISQIHQWQDQFGFDELLCQVYAAGITREDAMRSVRLLGEAILPVVSVTHF